MAVDTIYVKSTQPGNSATLAFQFAFKILAKTDLVVNKIDANGVLGPKLTLNVDYAVVFDAIAESGTVTFTVAPVTNGFALIANPTAESPVELSGAYANRPVKPTITCYYYSTDLGSYEKWVVAAQRWFLIG